ncbi:hypothetical protein QTP70_034656 [Hemibagrus guttatus]|uniref:ribonuclease H n=1 Tax=Hemibagrus guttatus TaxID=175788 RepID=A0AAE0V569_9TELE|nr:hypothetical protein QTP70_034656 [Hemibagrus guttatus]KAK3565679.1 hypothetical protein QTP86_014051 [Hemibagrus guttatus]
MPSTFSERSTEQEEEVFPDISKVPEVYLALKEVFNKARATSFPPHRSYDCAIDLIPGTTPPRGHLYSLSAPEREVMQKYLNEAPAAGLIRPSSSPAGAGFFFADKKDGGLRPCIDYRGLNQITVKDRYPLLLIYSAFEVLQDAVIFTKLDLRNAYHLIRIREGDEWKAAFNTASGHYEYLVMPFSLNNTPSVFQNLVSDLLGDMLNQFTFFVYLDDILIFSKSETEHVQHVVCGRYSDTAKVEAVKDCPVPETRKALQQFLGFANFYRRFIQGYSSIASPLHQLTSSKKRFVCSPVAQAAFSKLKDWFSYAPILTLPNPRKQFFVEVDASDLGMGVVLSQRADKDNRVHPCAFFSR